MLHFRGRNRKKSLVFHLTSVKYITTSSLVFSFHFCSLLSLPPILFPKKSLNEKCMEMWRTENLSLQKLRSLLLNIDRYSQESSSYIRFQNQNKTKPYKRKKKQRDKHTHKFTSKYMIHDTALVCVYIYVLLVIDY